MDLLQLPIIYQSVIFSGMALNNSFNESLLVREVVKGNTAAFQQIYLHYFDHLLSHAVQITKNPIIAEDIIQDVFLKTWERRAQFSNFEKIGGWLFVSVHNAGINYLKRANREVSHDAFIAEQFTEDNKAALEIVEAQYKLLESAINNLPEQRKRVFLLCKYEGYTYEQTSEMLSISKNTVKDHMTKAAESIRNFVMNDANQSLVVVSGCFLEYFL